MLSADVPYTGTVTMEFSLWTGQTAGNMIASPVSQDVQVDGGLFSVELNFGAISHWLEQRYLQIEIDGQVILPRQPFRPVPYALYAYKLFPGSDSLPWRQVGTSVFYQLGNVGIGPANPAHTLHVGASNAAVMIEGAAGSSAFLRFKRGNVDSNDELNYIALSAANGSLVTRVNGADRMRILANGRIGMGRNSPQARLHVYRPAENTDPGFMVELDDEVRFAVDEGITFVRDLLFTESSARIGSYLAGGTTSVCRTTGAGATAGILAQCSSSARYKTEIETMTSASALIGRLRAVSYRWLSDGSEDLGLVAEEVGAIESRLVTYNGENKIEGVKYDRLAAVLVAAHQEQQTGTFRELARRDDDIARLREELSELRQQTGQLLALLEAGGRGPLVHQGVSERGGAGRSNCGRID